MRLEGKCAIVVGAGQSPGEGIGNGRATVVRFAAEGARVMAVDRDPASAEATAAQARAAGGDCVAFEADVTREAMLAAMVAAANRVSQGQGSEILETVEGEEVRIVIVPGAAYPIVVRGATHGNQVISFKQPIHVLEPVILYVGVVQQDAAHGPVGQVGGTGQRQRIADAAGLLEEGSDLLEGLLAKASSPWVQARIVNRARDLFLARIRHEGLRGPDAARPFAIVEQARGRALLELLRARPVAGVAQPAALKKQEREIAELQRRLFQPKVALPTKNFEKVIVASPMKLTISIAER